MAIFAARPAAVADECGVDLADLIAKCQSYVRFPAEPKVPPSAECCGVVQSVDEPCLCAKVTPLVEQWICMEKAVFVARYCGRPLQPGSYCGSNIPTNKEKHLFSPKYGGKH
ncbi:hypothetical protein EJB05_37002, partial [Eragrostis curvula]